MGSSTHIGSKPKSLGRHLEGTPAKRRGGSDALFGGKCQRQSLRLLRPHLGRFLAMTVHGLTLIELILVMALVVTLAGLATVSLSRSVQARSVDHFVKDLTAYLRYLQFHAIETGNTCKVTTDSETGSLTSFVRDGASGQFESVRTPYSGRFEKVGVFSIELNRDDEVYFFPDGTVTRNKFFVSRNGEAQVTVEIKNRIGAFGVTFHG